MREKFTDLSSRMNIYPDKLPLVSNLIVFFVLLIWFFFSYYQWIGDSEFWPISLAGHWGQSSQNPSLLYKAVFHGTLSWIHLWDLSNVLHIKIAKALYAGLGVAIVLVLQHILKSKLGPVKALILILFLLSNSMAFANLGLIRSDNLATLLLLILFWILSRFDPVEWKKLFGVLVLGSIPVFLSTPKAVYGILILWVYVFFYVRPSLRLRFLNASMAVLILALLTVIGLSKMELMPELYDSLISALNYHLKAQSHYSGFLSRFNKPYFLKDLVFYGAIIFFFGWQLILIPRKKNSRNLGLTACTAMGIMVGGAFLMQRPSLPFFLSSLLPFFFLCLLPIFARIKRKWLVSLLVGNLLYSTLWGHHELFFVSNKIQVETIHKIEVRLAKCNPNSIIFDGLALFPSARRVHSLLAYVASDDEIALYGGIDALQREIPELVILTSRIVHNSYLFNDFIIRNYVSVGKGYWLRKDIVLSCSINFKDLPMSWEAFNYTVDERI